MPSGRKTSPLRAISFRSWMHPVVVSCSLVALAVYAPACSGDVQDKRATTGGSTGGAAGAGGEGGSSGTGMAGNGGSGGSGGTGAGGSPIDGGPGGVEYFANSLFTHVPRFMVFKVDHTRNLCFRIWVEGFVGPGPTTIMVTNPFVVGRAEVTPNVNDCMVSMGFPPAPATYADAVSGMGTITIKGNFPCAVDVHATISYDPVGPWVPASEAFDVDALNVDGGCG